MAHLFALLVAGPILTTMSADKWHLQLVSSRPFHVQLTSTFRGEEIGADRAQILVAVPPRTHEQPDVVHTAKLTIAGKEVMLTPLADRSPLRRALLESHRTVSPSELAQGIVLRQTFIGTTHRYRLTPGPGPRVGKPISSRERSFYTSAAAASPWKDRDYQEFLRTHHLLWDRRTEDAISFARRAYRFVTSHFRYEKPSRLAPFQALLEGRGECGDVSLGFNGILRANGIPARARIGRWIENGQGTDEGQSVHVRSEFYIDEVGWIPVDATAGMGTPEADEGRHFGFNEGVDFLTLHLDPDLEFLKWATGKPHTLRWVQQVQLFLWGPSVEFGRLERRESYEVIPASLG
jgi:transglutaminase-like putative cysteine protease